MNTIRKTALALSVPFGLAAAGFAADQIHMTRRIEGTVMTWVETSCGNNFFTTECAPGKKEEGDTKSYALFRPAGEKIGTGIDISALVLPEEKERLVNEWAHSGAGKKYQATYKQSLLELITAPLKERSDYYGLTFGPKP